ncbi:PhzF family phenazine biosynthesis protein [Nesterenkonia sp. F]|uniref:PhzF family phenazine biosynthesis protein n=1 Tax=Nesterenkonia sp. F TaxID=795955 RepID=UPI000255D2A5|nr:PhzF family phenazine biosynthesis protein [Nesterenkonia sp. F]
MDIGPRSTTSTPFRQVDVFGEVPFSGNPVAVVGGSQELTTEQMQAISRWTNLSECTFLLPPQDDGTDAVADYRVRIFSLDEELSFAGHPTLGTARAWLDMGGVPAREDVIIQECGVGMVEIRRDGDDGERLAFAAPDLLRSGAVDDAQLEQILAALGISRDVVVGAAWADNGPGWVGLLLDSPETVLSLRPNYGRTPELSTPYIGVAAVREDGSATDLEVRAFFPDDAGAVREDPVTGSLNASLGQWLTDAGHLTTPYTAAQGTVLDRRGRVHLTVADGRLWVGGSTHVAVAGGIDLGLD